jgi:hypothetical protein
VPSIRKIYRMAQHIPGYDFGKTAARSGLDAQAFDELKQSVLFTADDTRYLSMAGTVLADQIEAVLDVWYGFVGSHPHLVRYFMNASGQPQGDYLAAVRKRFGQWILDTCTKPYDAAWLNYQQEIGLRHHRTKKNVTDSADATPIVHLRYLIAFIYPITATIKPFLAKGGHSTNDVDAMFHAWFKSVTMQVALWTAPYVQPDDF